MKGIERRFAGERRERVEGGWKFEIERENARVDERGEKKERERLVGATSSVTTSPTSPN